LYGIGDEVWAVRKPSPFNQFKPVPANGFPQAELLPLTAGLRDLGWRCRDLFGLELYGVDCIQTAAGLVVIEVNDFPNYTGVPNASEKLADYVIRRAEQERAS
jgi:glutathione synthase/RimK-type ligase-like ATP-grasp enzyme